MGYRCVSYFQCEECNNTIITDGASLFDVKSASIDEDICLSSMLTNSGCSKKYFWDEGTFFGHPVYIFRGYCQHNIPFWNDFNLKAR